VTEETSGSVIRCIRSNGDVRVSAGGKDGGRPRSRRGFFRDEDSPPRYYLGPEGLIRPLFTSRIFSNDAQARPPRDGGQIPAWR